jgi:hypothetical protein
MYTFHGPKLVSFYAFSSATAVKEAMRLRWKHLHALGIRNPKEAIGPARLTTKASLSTRGRELAKRLEERGIAVDWPAALAEDWPGDNLYIDAFFWLPPARPKRRRRGWLILEQEVADLDAPPTMPFGFTTGAPSPGVDEAVAYEVVRKDQAWFVAHPGAMLRERAWVPGESPPAPPGEGAWVKVVRDETGGMSREVLFVPIGEETPHGRANPHSPWVKK